MNISVRDYIRKKALGITGLIETDIDPRVRDERPTFINNISEIMSDKLKEYNVWYAGDSDELLNFYTRTNTIDYNTDPLYNRNKKSYFWAVSSTEGDTKRTHSGQPRNIVDTLVNIIKSPKFKANSDAVSKKLSYILDRNNFDRMLIQKARPFTFVEGWGAWKINYDKNLSSVPILLYYRADSVDFVYKSNILMAIIYRDYYQDSKGNNYLLFETRRRAGKDLIIEKDLFRIEGNSEIMVQIELTDLDQLKDTEKRLKISNYDGFLGYPNIFYEDSTGDLPGRSIFTGKIDLFDDLDQCLSQESNAVRRSTPTEVWDTNFLEKDSRTGMPVMPHSFDRKYVSYRGLRGGDGIAGSVPVTTTQPNIDFVSYSSSALNLLINIVSGILSPATLGIDIAKKDNADAQREKEKVTIFTRNIVITEETKILKIIARELLCAQELMNTGKISYYDYDITVMYDEFSDASWESRSTAILNVWQAGLMSDRMALMMLYGDSLSKKSFDAELKFVEQAKSQMMGGNDILGELGAELGGNSGNEFNMEHASGENAGEIKTEVYE